MELHQQTHNYACKSPCSVFIELFTLLSSFNYHGCYKIPAHESSFNTKLQDNTGIVQGYCQNLCLSPNEVLKHIKHHCCQRQVTVSKWTMLLFLLMSRTKFIIAKLLTSWSVQMLQRNYSWSEKVSNRTSKLNHLLEKCSYCLMSEGGWLLNAVLILLPHFHFSGFKYQEFGLWR